MALRKQEAENKIYCLFRLKKANGCLFYSVPGAYAHTRVPRLVFYSILFKQKWTKEAGTRVRLRRSRYLSPACFERVDAPSSMPKRPSERSTCAYEGYMEPKGIHWQLAPVRTIHE